MIRNVKDLLVWQKAIDLACEVLALVAKLPRSEAWTLGDQIRRAAISIAANIAEGHGRRTRGELLRLLSIANGSLKERKTLLLLIERRGLADSGNLVELLRIVNEIGRMLTGFHRKLSTIR